MFNLSMIGVKLDWLSNFLCHLKKTSRLFVVRIDHEPMRLLDSCMLIWLQLRWVMCCLQKQINPIFVKLVNHHCSFNLVVPCNNRLGFLCSIAT